MQKIELLSTMFATGACAGSSYNTSAQIGDDYMKNNVRLCGLPAYPYTEVSYKQQNICRPGIAAMTKCLYRFFLLINKMCALSVSF